MPLLCVIIDNLIDDITYAYQTYASLLDHLFEHVNDSAPLQKQTQN